MRRESNKNLSFKKSKVVIISSWHCFFPNEKGVFQTFDRFEYQPQINSEFGRNIFRFVGFACKIRLCLYLYVFVFLLHWCSFFIILSFSLYIKKKKTTCGFVETEFTKSPSKL